MSVLATLAASLAAACAPAPIAPQGATQLVVVNAPTHTATIASLAFWERRSGCWRVTAGPWPARLGRNGLSADRREGDGTTPLGTFPFGRTIYGMEADPGVRSVYHRLVCGDWWIPTRARPPTTPSTTSPAEQGRRFAE